MIMSIVLLTEFFKMSDLTINEILEYLSENKDFFHKQFNIIKIGVFGSFARNEQTENSDIDILIDIPKGTNKIFEKRLMFKNMISKHFSKPVDVCHQRAIRPAFIDLIFKEVIYV